MIGVLVGNLSAGRGRVTKEMLHPPFEKAFLEEGLENPPKDTKRGTFRKNELSKRDYLREEGYEREKSSEKKDPGPSNDPAGGVHDPSRRRGRESLAQLEAEKP